MGSNLANAEIYFLQCCKVVWASLKGVIKGHFFAILFSNGVSLRTFHALDFVF